MEKRKKIILAGGIFFICALFGILGLPVIKSKLNNEKIERSFHYDASGLIDNAMEQLKTDSPEAEIITDVQTTEKVIALTFKGLSDSEVNGKILDLMWEYDRKGTFFLPGIPAAEDSKTVQLMAEMGHKLGSNTLSGSKHMEEYTREQLVTDFSRTNDIVGKLTGQSPKLLLCNGTAYTPGVLKAAYASGNKRVVSSRHFISYQSFTSYSQVLDYINSLDYGTILTLKLDGVLDEEEYGTTATSASPDEEEYGTAATSASPDEEEYGTTATSASPDEKEYGTTAMSAPPVEDRRTATAEEAEDTGLTEEERLPQILDWILQALDETNYKTVFAEELPDYEDMDFSKDFKDLREQNNGALAKVYTQVTTGENLVSISFRGIQDEERLKEILEFLNENNIKATFFVTGKDILNYEDRIRTILNEGHQIGNGGMTGEKLISMDFNKVCFEIYKCDKLLEGKFGIQSKLFMPVYGKYNDLIREAASALDYSLVTYNKNPVTNTDESVGDIMAYYKNGFNKGDIIFFRLDYYRDILQVVKQTFRLLNGSSYETCSIRALIANRSVEMVNPPGDYEKTAIGTASGVGKASDNSKKSEERRKQIEELRKRNNKALAKEIRMVYTTERALSYTYTGISNTKVLKDVLKNLDELKAKGTFFVTEEEIKNNEDSIRQIAAAGHEMEICLKASASTDYYSVCDSILNIQEEVKKLCGRKPTLVRYTYEIDMTDEILEAVSSTGCTVVWQDISFASSKVGRQGTLDQVKQYVFNEGNISARRGSVIFFRMDFYEDPTLIGRLMQCFAKDRINTIAFQDKIKDNGSSYRLESLESLLNSPDIYEYPVAAENILPSVKDKIYSGHLKNMDTDEIFEYLQKRYIGNPNVSTSNTLPGFTEEELAALNKSGTFTEDKVLFLTFDDWGSDKPVNQILYVLKKYGVKVQFFVRTNYMTSNPNLLRAIAEDGHDVGSHTDQHLSFANSNDAQGEDDVSAMYTPISGEEAAARKKDLLLSYNKLQSVIGDVETNGIPMLNKIFRPPTLAMSKIGMVTILDMGFDYIVSGDFSTHDYEANDAGELADEILNGILREDGSKKTLQNGSILVLHMSDDGSIPTGDNDITAEALDSAIPKLLEEGYQFAKLSDYLSGEK